MKRTKARRGGLSRGGVIRLISFFIFLILAAGYVAASEHRAAKESRALYDRGGSHAMSELTASASELCETLERCALSTSGGVTARLCAELYASAQSAQTALGVLPLDAGAPEKAAVLINRIGDYAVTMCGCGQSPTDAQRGELLQLRDAAVVLRDELIGVSEGLEDGSVVYSPQNETSPGLALLASDAEISEPTEDTLSEALRRLGNELGELPSLSYDGRWSAHLDAAEPRLLAGLEEIGEARARTIAAGFLSLPEGRVYVSGKTGGEIPCWLLTAKPDAGESTVAITLRGGIVRYLATEHINREAAMSEEDAESAASEFLTRLGFSSLKLVSSEAEDGVAVFNYAHAVGDTIYYNDALRVSVGLDSGAVVGYDATGHIMYHVSEETPAPQVDPQTAALALPGGVEFEPRGMAVIHSCGKNRLLCYEYRCPASDGGTLSVFVNAATGAQVAIETSR